MSLPNTDETPVKTRAINAVLARLTNGLINPAAGDLELRGESIRRGITVEELMGVFPSAIVLDGAERVLPGTTRGDVYEFPVLIKLCLGPDNNAKPEQVDRFVALVQAVMELGPDDATPADGSGYTGLELREEDGNVIGFLSGGGEATPFYQATDGASIVGAVVNYSVQYRRLRGNPWAQW